MLLALNRQFLNIVIYFFYLQENINYISNLLHMLCMWKFKYFFTKSYALWSWPPLSQNSGTASAHGGHTNEGTQVEIKTQDLFGDVVQSY